MRTSGSVQDHELVDQVGLMLEFQYDWDSAWLLAKPEAGMLTLRELSVLETAHLNAHFAA